MVAFHGDAWYRTLFDHPGLLFTLPDHRREFVLQASRLLHKRTTGVNQPKIAFHASNIVMVPSELPSCNDSCSGKSGTSITGTAGTPSDAIS